MSQSTRYLNVLSVSLVYCLLFEAWPATAGTVDKKEVVHTENVTGPRQNVSSIVKKTQLAK